MVQLGVDNDEDNWLERAAKKLSNIGGGRGVQDPKPSFMNQVVNSNNGGIVNASTSRNSVINTPFPKSTGFGGAGSAGRIPAPKAGGNGGGGSVIGLVNQMLGKNKLGASQPEPQSDIDKLIAELLGQTKEGHTWESRAEDEAMINSIFGSQLANIANARTQTNSRFDTSLANTKDLYGGHEHDIRNADKAQYQQIADTQKTNTDQVFDSGVSQMQATQSKNLNEQTEMMNRLGLQASAPLAQDSANQQQGAIDSLIASKTAQQNQNTAYAGANMQRNDERAQSIADESVSQQTDLSRQLQDILGQLDGKEADINSAKAEALYGASRESQSNWRSDREYATSALAQLLESQAKASSQEGGGANAPQMQNIMASLGINDPKQQSAYSSAYTDAMLNANYVPGGRMDEKTAYLKYLTGQDQYDGLDQNLLRQLITSDLNYGSYKAGAPTS